MKKFRVLDLFSGIGGFSLGLERTGGFETVAFCEIEPYCRAVLAKHWPAVPCYPDIRDLTADALLRDGITVDVICGGFPCQDISYAGKRSGLQGSRSGLWKEYARIIGELRPRFAIMENVAGLLSLGLGDVLGDLAALGYNATWDCIPASAVGAPHRRDRVWIIAHADSQSVQKQSECELGGGNTSVSISNRAVLHADSQWQHDGTEHAAVASASQSLATGVGQRLEGRRHVRLATDAEAGQPMLHGQKFERQWEFEPNVGRVVARLSSWMDGGRLENADACQGGTAEILCALQYPDGSASLQWSARGFDGIQAAEILFAKVCEYEGPPKSLGNLSLACEGSSQRTMRGLWFDGSIACSSCRWAAKEQRSYQHPNALRLVSQLLACDCRAAWLDPAGSTGYFKRADRIKALGNAVVPQIPELIGRAILKAEGLAA